jgi:hypothetical protein
MRLPGIDSLLQIRGRILGLEDDEIGSELGLVGADQAAFDVVVVLHERQQGSIELFAFLIPVVFVVRLLRKSQLMQ